MTEIVVYSGYILMITGRKTKPQDLSNNLKYVTIKMITLTIKENNKKKK